MNNWLDAINELELPPLDEGAHDSPEAGLCAMEMVAFMERLPHSDHPGCTCPVIAEFVIAANDRMLDRELLKPILPELVGTVSPEHEAERLRYLVMDWMRGVIVPVLSAAGVDCSEIVAAQSYDELKVAAANAVYAANAAASAAYAASAASAADAASASANAVCAAYAASANAVCAAYTDAASASANAAANAADICDNLYIEAIRGLLAIGPKPRGFSRPERALELVAL